jgi:hypothetical protein
MTSNLRTLSWAGGQFSVYLFHSARRLGGTVKSSQKVYQFNVKKDLTSTSFVLMDAKPVEFLGMKCIRGKHRPMKESFWTNGNIIYIPFEMITSVVEFDSYEAYREAVKRFNEEKIK